MKLLRVAASPRRLPFVRLVCASVALTSLRATPPSTAPVAPTPPPAGAPVTAPAATPPNLPSGTDPGYWEGGGSLPHSGFIRETLRQQYTGASTAPTERPPTRRLVPVICVRFADDDGRVLPELESIRKTLFGASVGTRSLTQFYRDMSGGQFVVDGVVVGWIRLPQPESYYANANPEGVKHQGELLEYAFREADKQLDFRDFDNDGPDGVANTADDDGKVDLVMLVQARKGHESDPGGGHIWSHFWNYSQKALGRGGKPFETSDYRFGLEVTSGPKIQIEDYTLQAGMSGAGVAGVQIGLFCHEFGHALGVPDLYDRVSPVWHGLGRWCVMAWGGDGWDGRSPDRPMPMSAWARAHIGWAKVQRISTPGLVTLQSTYESNVIYRIDVPGPGPYDEYFLLEYRTPTWQPQPYQVNWDADLPAAGVAIWHVDESVGRTLPKFPPVPNPNWPFVDAGAGQNDDSTRPDTSTGEATGFAQPHALVAMVEADGKSDLVYNAQKVAYGVEAENKGDAGDLWPENATFTDDPKYLAGARSYHDKATGISLRFPRKGQMVVDALPIATEGLLAADAAPPAGAPPSGAEAQPAEAGASGPAAAPVVVTESLAPPPPPPPPPAPPANVAAAAATTKLAKMKATELTPIAKGAPAGTGGGPASKKEAGPALVKAKTAPLLAGAEKSSPTGVATATPSTIRPSEALLAQLDKPAFRARPELTDPNLKNLSQRVTDAWTAAKKEVATEQPVRLAEATDPLHRFAGEVTPEKPAKREFGSIQEMLVRTRSLVLTDADQRVLRETPSWELEKVADPAVRTGLMLESSRLRTKVFKPSQSITNELESVVSAISRENAGRPVEYVAAPRGERAERVTGLRLPSKPQMQLQQDAIARVNNELKGVLGRGTQQVEIIERPDDSPLVKRFQQFKAVSATKSLPIFGRQATLYYENKEAPVLTALTNTMVNAEAVKVAKLDRPLTANEAKTIVAKTLRLDVALLGVPHEGIYLVGGDPEQGRLTFEVPLPTPTGHDPLLAYVDQQDRKILDVK